MERKTADELVTEGMGRYNDMLARKDIAPQEFLDSHPEYRPVADRLKPLLEKSRDMYKNLRVSSEDYPVAGELMDALEEMGFDFLRSDPKGTPATLRGEIVFDVPFDTDEYGGAFNCPDGRLELRIHLFSFGGKKERRFSYAIDALNPVDEDMRKRYFSCIPVPEPVPAGEALESIRKYIEERNLKADV
ncbi:MAG: hypothetical protein HYW25_03235 [Candidatus Aenigmarchaeota archaeon]|nr:hypothetical protein [Candidatus Aenigmarchaeota archaeon]